MVKNKVLNNFGISCSNCKMEGHFCYTPNGADYRTCPLCGNWDNEIIFKLCDKNKAFDDYYEQLHDGFDFCDRCKILYDIGCKHAANGCTSDIFNGHYVSKWRYIPSNEVNVGMPQFDNTADFENEIMNIEVLEWSCPNNGIHCTKGSYSKDKYPQYYRSICPLLIENKN